MSRTPRRISSTDIYHVIFRGAGKQTIFEDDSDRLLFLRLLSKYLKELDGETFAWTLMSNHVHIVLHMNLEAIAKLMQKLGATYFRNFNDHAGRTGPVIERRFASEPINTDEYLMTCIRYVHQNIEKAGVCRMEEYKWSSYGDYAGSVHPGVPLETSTDFALAVFGGTTGFEVFHASREYAVDCIDAGKSANRMNDDEALIFAKSLLGDEIFCHLKEYTTARRNELLAKFRETAVSYRQLGRLTGIGENAVMRAWTASASSKR